MSAEPEKKREVPGRYDFAARRRSKRQRREKGCWLYIPMVELKRAGIDPEGDPPYYRVWPGPRRTVMVTLYKGQY